MSATAAQPSLTLPAQKDASLRRRGLAAWVVGAALTEARADGARTATLQASPDGFGVYERLGFRTVVTLYASLVT